MNPNDAGQTRQWHLERSFSLTHLIAMLSIAISAFVFFSGIDTRITILETESAYSKREDARLEQRYRDAIAEIKASLNRIEQKLDTKADKR